MNTIHLMIGIQGSGKTTFSKRLSKSLNIEIVSTDLIRKEMSEILEEQVWSMVCQNCASKLAKGKDVIFDATNITPKVRTRLKENVKQIYPDFSIGCYFFDVNPSICVKRVEKRNTMMGELYLPTEVIYSYYHKTVPPTFDEGFIFIKIVNENGVIREIRKKGSSS